MKAEELLRLADELLPELVRRYHLSEWWIEVAVVDRSEMNSPEHVAEVHLEEPYRLATIFVQRQALPRMGPEKARRVLEYEVQHLTGWWLEELEALVMAALEEEDERTQRVIAAAFRRAHELYRSTLGRLLKAGNNWEEEEA